MTGIQGVHYDAYIGALICKVHGTGIHPQEEALKRHLRGDGHHCKGKVLKEAVVALMRLPLKSCQDVRNACPSLDQQPAHPIAVLTIHPGWSCIRCRGSFLTTSSHLRDRHASAMHQQLPRKHTAAQPFWESCSLQTVFAMTGDRQYFRVKEDAGGSASQHTASDSITSGTNIDQQARDFVRSVQIQRQENEVMEKAATNVNADPAAGDTGEELWMKKLGLSRYIAGLHKDEMAESYKLPTAKDNPTLRMLHDVSNMILRQTWQECQHGPQQRLTDPQAVRISSFWHAADPESKNKTFRRSVRKETLAYYLNHWRQLLTFIWKGWQGDLFPRSLADLAKSKGENAGHSEDADDQGSYADETDEPGGSSVSQAGSRTSPGGAGIAGRFFQLTKRQEDCLRRFSDVASSLISNKTIDAEQRQNALRHVVSEIARSLIQQHLASSSFESPILAYTAALSVNVKYSCWEEPGSFNNHLSALIYCGQLWIFRFSCDTIDSRALSRGSSDQEEQGDGLDEELDSLMRRYFTNTVSKPMSYLLLWRRRLFGIAPVTMVNRPATWDLAKTTVGYKGVCISMDEVRQLCRHTTERARRLLFDDLMFGVDYLPKLSPKDLQDTDSDRSIGWWFGRHAANSSILEGHESALIEHVAGTPELRNLYLEESAGNDGSGRLQWRRSGIRLYRQLVQEFLQALAVAIHFGSGPPVRAPEFLSPMWRNTEQLRHIQLRHGKVMMHLVEHKMMATTGKNVNNIRFLPDEPGSLIVNYLAYVFPVLESMAWQDDVCTTPSSYLWCSAGGQRWEPERFGDMLKAACRRARVPPVGTAVWRQISSAIINVHFDQADRECFAIAQDAEEGGADVDEDGSDMMASTLVSMSNHSLRTHRIAYANVSPFANVWDGKLLKSYQASKAWATFFGFDTEEHMLAAAQSARRKRSLSTLTGEQEGVRKALKIGRELHKRHWTSAALLNEARKLYQDSELRWKSPEQEQAMRLVANHAPEVLLVLATGAGKSLTFILGSNISGARTTIVVVPLVLLRLDLLRRCRTLGLSPIVWSSTADVAMGMDGSPTLLFVSVEVAAKHPFRQYCRRLYDVGNLDRIIIDECHLVQTSAHYRKHMSQLNELRQFQVQFVYMTATLPPRLERVLVQRQHIGTASVVRGCTKRANIRYGVQHLKVPQGGSFLAFACQTVLRKWENGKRRAWQGSRVMIFVRSCREAEEAAECLKCSYYHRDIGGVEEKESRLEEWISGASGSPFLACTTAAGAGVDYPHVRWVVHLEDPYGLVDFVQESGRAGRDGELAGSTVFMKREPHLPPPRTPLDHPDPQDHQDINEYLQGRVCRRLSLARVFDEEAYWHSCIEADAQCDVCEAREGEHSSIGKQGEVGSEPSSYDGGTGAVDIREEERDGEESGENNGLIRHRHDCMQEQYQLDEYLRGLSQVRGDCMLCRILQPGRDWRHSMGECTGRFKWEYVRCKRATVQSTSGRGGWMKSYSACYMCAQPQGVCRRWKQGGRSERCEYGDIVMPAVWALWEEGGKERRWVRERLEVEVRSGSEALVAAGRKGQFGGMECVVGVPITAALLERWGGGASSVLEAAT